MRNHRSDKHRLRTFTALTAVAVLTVAGLALAACGRGEEGAGAHSSGASARDADRAKLERAALKHAECMRREGVDVPDPKPGQGGIILTGPPAGGDPAAQGRAMKKCARYLRNVPPPKLTDAQRTEMRDAALAHARCMRARGIDFPDPQFDGNAGISVKIGEGFDPSDPRVREAERRCQRLLPRRGAEPLG